jgi:uncharacterized protein (TIRG00374 family)
MTRNTRKTRACQSGLEVPPKAEQSYSLPIGKIVGGLIFGALVLVAIGLYTDSAALISTLAAFDRTALLLVLALTGINWVLRFIKWHGYLILLGQRPQISDSSWVFLSGFSMAVTPGKFGELLKAWLLEERTGTPMTTTASVVITERLTDFLALVLLASWGVYTTGHGEIVMFIAVIGSILSLAILASESFALRVIRSTATLPLLKKLTPKLEVLYLSMAKLVTPWPLLAATAISIAAWGCECVGFYLVIDALPNTSPDLGEATFIYSFATIFGAITLLPGGLGTTEGSLVGLTHSVFGLATKQSAGAAALIIRFCTLWIAVLVGSVLLLAFRRSTTPKDMLSEIQSTK